MSSQPTGRTPRRAQSHAGITVRYLDATGYFEHDLLSLRICTEPNPWFGGGRAFLTFRAQGTPFQSTVTGGFERPITCGTGEVKVLIEVRA